MFIIRTFTRLFDNRPASQFQPDFWDSSLRKEWREVRTGARRTDRDRLVEMHLHNII